MTTLRFQTPNEKQKLFLTATQKHVAFGGARGGGKSWAVRIKAVLLCLNYPGIKVMIIRKTFRELRENHIVQCADRLEPVCRQLARRDGRKERR